MYFAESNQINELLYRNMEAVYELKQRSFVFRAINKTYTNHSICFIYLCMNLWQVFLFSVYLLWHLEVSPILYNSSSFLYL